MRVQCLGHLVESPVFARFDAEHILVLVTCVVIAPTAKTITIAKMYWRKIC